MRIPPTRFTICRMSKPRRVVDVTKAELRRAATSARNMTHLVQALDFADGSTTRRKIAILLKRFGIATAHFSTRRNRKTDEEHAIARQKSHLKMRRKYSEMRASGQCQERWIFEDSLNADRKRGRENDLTIEFVKQAIASGCSYCGESSIRMTLDRIDNDVGHTMRNVVAACIRCNIVRRDMPYEAWLTIAPAMRRARRNGLFKDWRCASHAGIRQQQTKTPPRS